MPIEISELVAITGLPERTLRDWRKKEILPAELELDTAIRSIIIHLKQKQSDPNADELYAERVRLTKAQADHKELQVAELEGRLIEVGAAKKAWISLVTAFRAKILTVPTKLAPQLTNLSVAEAEYLIRDQLYEALAELSQGQDQDGPD